MLIMVLPGVLVEAIVLVINFGELISATKGKVNLLNYGALNSKIDSTYNRST
jgi:hypothetical protein